MKCQNKILLIYTGGTIGMQKQAETDSLVPFDFANIQEHIPELKLIDKQIDAISFEKPIDSSNIRKEHWQKMADIINENYDDYAGFVILHGSDTMAYTASALSFILENLSKPVILTGSQLPIGDLRTDAKENIITSIEIAGKYENEKPVVPEVAIYFEFKLLRGNRTTKFSTDDFNAFHSPNYNPLAMSGVHLKYYNHRILTPSTGLFHVHKEMDENVFLLRVHPALRASHLEQIIQIPDLKVLILETYGAGNVLTSEWFLSLLKKANKEKGIILINVSQCIKGSISPYKYETGKKLMKLGTLNGKDLTIEAALTKSMYLLSKNLGYSSFKKAFERSLRGELTE